MPELSGEEVLNIVAGKYPEIPVIITTAIDDVDTAVRGGDLYIRYPDGTLKNLTATAGYGAVGFQGATSIAGCR